MVWESIRWCNGNIQTWYEYIPVKSFDGKSQRSYISGKFLVGLRPCLPEVCVIINTWMTFYIEIYVSDSKINVNYAIRK